MHKTFDDNLICVFCLWIVTTGSGKTDQRTGQFIWSAKISCPCEIVAVLLIFSFLIPSFFVWISIRFLDFHFCCNSNIIPIYLFQSRLSFHKTRNHNVGSLTLVFLLQVVLYHSSFLRFEEGHFEQYAEAILLLPDSVL